MPIWAWKPLPQVWHKCVGGRVGCVFSSCLSRPAFCLVGVYCLSFWLLLWVRLRQADLSAAALSHVAMSMLKSFAYPGSACRISVASGFLNPASGRHVLPIVFEPCARWFLLFVEPQCQGSCLASGCWEWFENSEDGSAVVVFHAACRWSRFHCRRGLWSGQLLYFDFGFLWDASAFPHCLLESVKRGTCLGDPVGHFGVDVCGAWECTAKVGEVVDGLESLPVHCDFWLLVWVSCMGQAETSTWSSWYWWWGRISRRRMKICSYPVASLYLCWRWGYSRPQRGGLWSGMNSLPLHLYLMGMPESDSLKASSASPRTSNWAGLGRGHSLAWLRLSPGTGLRSFHHPALGPSSRCRTAWRSSQIWPGSQTLSWSSTDPLCWLNQRLS